MRCEELERTLLVDLVATHHHQADRDADDLPGGDRLFQLRLTARPAQRECCVCGEQFCPSGCSRADDVEDGGVQVRKRYQSQPTGHGQSRGLARVRSG
jgi:hypothetical protein